MIDLIRMIGAKGNVTQEEVRKAKTRAAKARAKDETMRRLKDGRAHLQLTILDDMRRSGIEWNSAKGLSAALDRHASNVSRALLLLERKGLVDSRILPVTSIDDRVMKIKHYRLKEHAHG